MSKRVNLVIFAFVLAFGVAVVPAFAGKGGNGGGGGNNAPSSGSPSISIATVNGGPAPSAPGPLTLKYHDQLTFATNVVGVSGNEYPQVVVACFEDVNNDGTLDTSVTGPDVVYTDLNWPNATFQLGGTGLSIWSLRGGTATCQATLDAYSMTGKGETITPLANTATFSATFS